MMKILFILKRRDNYGYEHWNKLNDNIEELSSGLVNSVKFIVNMINHRIHKNVEAKYVIVQDNNDIDRVVYRFKPDIVIIEAFWVVPQKFEILKRLHPKVKWIVRCHSNSEFLANEGSAFGWLCDYLRGGVYVACNSERAFTDFTYIARSIMVGSNAILYLPNYYYMRPIAKHHYKPIGKVINIGCFGL